MHQELNIETYYPRDPVLRQYVAFYYFLHTEDSFAAQYYSFPNTLQALNIHKHARCTISGHRIEVAGHPSYAPLMVLQGKYVKPVEVQLSGALDKVTILFKPLGLNHFIDRPFVELAPHPFQLFDHWQGRSHAGKYLDLFFLEPELERRVVLLEHYLRAHFREFELAAALTKAANLLTDLENERSIEDIAREAFMSTRTFNRLFHRHVGISPVAFRNICRFRHSLYSRSGLPDEPTLTRLAYHSNFYDSSHFNRIYKKMAGENPSRFFKELQTYSDHKSFFRFLPH